MFYFTFNIMNSFYIDFGFFFCVWTYILGAWTYILGARRTGGTGGTGGPDGRAGGRVGRVQSMGKNQFWEYVPGKTLMLDI